MTSRRLHILWLIVIMALSTSGCTMLDKARMYDSLNMEANYLRSRVAKLEEENTQASDELSRLRNLQKELEDKLRGEIDDDKASLRMTDRGLVLTFLAEVFFNSGQAEIRSSGQGTLLRVAEVLQRKVPESKIFIEGHTDNQPIKRSGWSSNWDLSTARALAVLTFFLDQGQLEPQRLAVTGYGEFQPAADNSTSKGRQKNRRVEIVILPETK